MKDIKCIKDPSTKLSRILWRSYHIKNLWLSNILINDSLLFFFFTIVFLFGYLAYKEPRPLLFCMEEGEGRGRGVLTFTRLWYSYGLHGLEYIHFSIT